MSDTPDFLKNQKAGMTQDALKELQELVALFKRQNAEVDELEEQLKNAKKRFNQTSQEAIPTLLHSHGLSEIRLMSGEKIFVKEDLSVTITDEQKFFDWLEFRGEDDIIKLQLHFDRTESDKLSKLFAWLLDNEFDYEMHQGVHGQTKKKYFKEVLGLGQDDYEEGLEDGRYVKEEKVNIFAKIFKFNKTTIK